MQNTVNTSTHITKTLTNYKTHTYTHPHITKQVKTTTVHTLPKHSQITKPTHTLTHTSQNKLKQPQYKQFATKTSATT